MKLHAWQETREHRTLSLDEPLVVRKGDVVVVAVAHSWEEAASFVATLDRKATHAPED